MKNQMTITKQDQIENNKLYAIEIKNAVLNKLPRNLDITITECIPFPNEISCWTKFDVTKDGKNCGGYCFSANLYNEDYSFQTVVDAAVLSISDFNNDKRYL
jgi:hypothetical protein